MLLFCALFQNLNVARNCRKCFHRIIVYIFLTSLPSHFFFTESVGVLHLGQRGHVQGDHGNYVGDIWLWSVYVGADGCVQPSTQEVDVF